LGSEICDPSRKQKERDGFDLTCLKNVAESIDAVMLPRYNVQTEDESLQYGRGRAECDVFILPEFIRDRSGEIVLCCLTNRARRESGIVHGMST
jgi:hypothetical protein